MTTESTRVDVRSLQHLFSLITRVPRQAEVLLRDDRRRSRFNVPAGSRQKEATPCRNAIAGRRSWIATAATTECAEEI